MKGERTIPAGLRPAVEAALGLVADGLSMPAVARRLGYYVGGPRGTACSLQHWRRYPEWRERVELARRVAVRRKVERIAAELRAGASIDAATASAGSSRRFYAASRRDPAAAALFDAALARHVRPGRQLPGHLVEAVAAGLRGGATLRDACAAAGVPLGTVASWRRQPAGTIGGDRWRRLDDARRLGRASASAREVRL